MAAAAAEPPLEQLQAMPATTASIASVLSACKTANYRQVQEDSELFGRWKNALESFRDDLLEEGLPQNLVQSHRDLLCIIFKRFQVVVATSLTTPSKLRVDPVGDSAPARKEHILGEKNFALLRATDFVATSLPTMRSALLATTALQDSGLCPEAAALFCGMSWTHRNQTLAESAARTRPSFLRVEIDACKRQYPDLSQAQHLTTALTNMHMTGSEFWSPEILPEWDQTLVWLLGHVIAPLVKKRVPNDKIENLLVEYIFPAMQDSTLATATDRESTMSTGAVLDELDVSGDWLQAVSPASLSEKLRILKLDAEHAAYSGYYLSSTASVSNLTVNFEQALQALANYPLPINWATRASQLSACPLHLAAPELCPMGATCPLVHPQGQSWWDATECVFGVDNMTIVMLRKRLAAIAPLSVAAGATAAGSYPVVAQSTGQSNTRRGGNRRRGRGTQGGAHQGGSPTPAAQAAPQAAPQASAHANRDAPLASNKA